MHRYSTVQRPFVFIPRVFFLPPAYCRLRASGGVGGWVRGGSFVLAARVVHVLDPHCCFPFIGGYRGGRGHRSFSVSSPIQFSRDPPQIIVLASTVYGAGRNQVNAPNTVFIRCWGVSPVSTGILKYSDTETSIFGKKKCCCGVCPIPPHRPVQPSSSCPVS